MQPLERLGCPICAHGPPDPLNQFLTIGLLLLCLAFYSDGTCPNCRAGITSACVRGGVWGVNGIDGGQGEAVRVPLADGPLVKVPGSGHSDETLASLLTLSDVMGTRHHAAVSAEVEQGDTVAVVGDGAVGLCAILAAKRLGAGRIIALSRNPVRQALARTFGATDILSALGCFGMIMVESHPSYVLLACLLAVLGFGLALVLPAMTEATMSHAPRAQSGIASGTLNVSRQVGGVLGVAILGTLVGNQQTFLWGMHLAFVIAGGVLVLGLVSAWVFVSEHNMRHPKGKTSCTCLCTTAHDHEKQWSEGTVGKPSRTTSPANGVAS